MSNQLQFDQKKDTPNTSCQSRKHADGPIPYIVMLVLWGTAVFFSGRSLYRAATTADWPTTVGTVIESRVQQYEDHDQDGTYTVIYPSVTYTYTVDNKEYSSHQIAYYKLGGPYSSRADAQGVVEQYPSGRTVDVYYSPDEPSLAVLRPGILAGGWFMPAFLPLLIIGPPVLILWLQSSEQA